MARKKKEKKKGVEDEELQGGKKKGKKKLLMIPLALILVAAIGAAAVLFILPRFGINLLGGGEEDPDALPKNLETFSIGEAGKEEGDPGTLDETISLDTLLAEGEGSLLAVRKAEPVKTKPDGSSSSSAAAAPQAEQNMYIYDVAAPAEAVNRYLDAVLGGEERFVLIDDTLLHLEERPELEDAVGSLTIARPSVQEGHIFQIMVGWSQASSLTFRVSAPEGSIREPKKEEGFGLGSQVVETASLTEQLDKIKSLNPAQLGLEGDSMDAYDVLPVSGYVKVDGLDCRRFNVYVHRDSNQGGYSDIVSIIMLSSDQKHVYYKDPLSDAVTELR